METCAPGKHHWQKNGHRMSGHNRRQKWQCSKCGQETIRPPVRGEK